MNKLNKKYARISIKVPLLLFREGLVWFKKLFRRANPYQGQLRN